LQVLSKRVEESLYGGEIGARIGSEGYRAPLDLFEFNFEDTGSLICPEAGCKG